MAKEIDPDDAPFEIPPFDEDEYVRKELISFRTTVVLFVFSLVTAGLTFLLWRATNLRFLFLLAIAMALGLLLRLVFRAAKIDISHWKRREWLGTFALYFFFWMGFTLILVNPPTSDNSPPVIEMVATPPVQGYGYPIDLAAYVGDNHRLRGEPEFCLAPGNATTFPTSGCVSLAWTHVEATQVWTSRWTPTTNGTHVLFARAADDGGHEATARTFVNVSSPFAVVRPRSATVFEDPGDVVTIRLDPALVNQDLLSVRYVVGGREYNMTPPTEEEPDYWTTKPTFPGWSKGDNNLTFVAVQQPFYLHGHTRAGGVARDDAARRTYTVATDFPDLGRNKEPEPGVRQPPNLAGTPGFEAPALLAALGLALFLAVRRSRRHG